MPASADAVFINVPFDRRYKKLFDSLLFAVHACGFVARCAREQDDGSQVRVDKLYDIIADCRYGIHDRSRTSLDSANRLPRFNMPLEPRWPQVGDFGWPPGWKRTTKLSSHERSSEL